MSNIKVSATFTIWGTLKTVELFYEIDVSNAAIKAPIEMPITTILLISTVTSCTTKVSLFAFYIVSQVFPTVTWSRDADALLFRSTLTLLISLLT